MNKTFTPQQVAALSWAAIREGKDQSVSDYLDSVISDIDRQKTYDRVSMAVSKIKSADETEKDRLLGLIEKELE